jgi:hypothetical protein
MSINKLIFRIWIHLYSIIHSVTMLIFIYFCFLFLFIDFRLIFYLIIIFSFLFRFLMFDIIILGLRRIHSTFIWYKIIIIIILIIFSIFWWMYHALRKNIYIRIFRRTFGNSLYYFFLCWFRSLLRVFSHATFSLNNHTLLWFRVNRARNYVKPDLSNFLESWTERDFLVFDVFFLTYHDKFKMFITLFNPINHIFGKVELFYLSSFFHKQHFFLTMKRRLFILPSTQ